MFFVLDEALVAQLHGLGASGITSRDVKNFLSPSFKQVYRRQDTTLCKRNSFIQFREHDLRQVDQVWKRVGTNGNVVL